MLDHSGQPADCDHDKIEIIAYESGDTKQNETSQKLLDIDHTSLIGVLPNCIRLIFKVETEHIRCEITTRTVTVLKQSNDLPQLISG